MPDLRAQRKLLQPSFQEMQPDLARLETVEPLGVRYAGGVGKVVVEV